MDTTFDISESTQIDRPLILRAALSPGTLVFLPAMLVGLRLGTRAKIFDIFSTKGAT